MSFGIIASTAATALGASSLTSALVGGGASLLGSAITRKSDKKAINDAQNVQQDAAREANQIQKYIYDTTREDNRGALDARNNALRYLQHGLGFEPKLETKEQIRAKLLGQGVNNTLPQQNTNVLGATTTNNAPKTDAISTLTDLGIITNNNVSQEEFDLRTALGLHAFDNSPEAKARLQAFRDIQGANQTNNNVSNVPDDIDAQVESEYARQQQENQGLEGMGGFGDFNKEFSMQDFLADPSYKFRQEEADKAISRVYGGTGSFLSGGALKGFAKYNQDLASNEFGNAFDRFNTNKTNRFNRFASLSGLGQQGYAPIANAGQNYANQAASNITGLGNSMGSAALYGGLYGGRQLNNALTNTGSFVQNALNRIPTTTSSFNPNFLGSGIQSYGDM